MPRLSDSMEQGAILAWRKSLGEEVAVGEELVEIETDKANMTYDSEVAGKLSEILVPEGRSVPVGEPIARIETIERPQTGTPATKGDLSPGSVRGESGVKASPLARRLARELGIDLATIRGSGSGGRVVKSDVEAARLAGTELATADGEPALEPRPRQVESAKGAVEAVAPTRLQETVARRMSESKATAPHFYLQVEVDMSAAVAARAGLKQLARDGQAAPSFNDLVIKACALAMRDFPRVNGSYANAQFELHGRINVGFAVAGDGTLMVPTIFDADRKGLIEIAEESHVLAARVRDGSITASELAGGTFTVSNLGMYGVSNFHGVINPPQAAILAVGEISNRAVVRDNEIVSAPIMILSLSGDHRILNGVDGAEFLARVRALLEHPLGLAL